MSNDVIGNAGSNYRDALLRHSSEYHSRIRDMRIQEVGIKATIRIPKTENNLDLYKDYINQDSDYFIKESYVEPRFTMYFQQLSLLGKSSEDTLPLEIQVMTNENLPKDSIISLPEINTAGGRTIRDWQVLRVDTKDFGAYYTRLAYAVPARLQESEVQAPDYKPQEVSNHIILGNMNNTIYFVSNIKLPAISY